MDRGPGADDPDEQEPEEEEGSLEELLSSRDRDELEDESRPSRPRAALPLLILVAAVALVLLASLLTRDKVSSGPGGVLGVAGYRAQAQVDARPAPPFSLPALRGSGSISLASLRGHVVVLNFWASWCQPCRLEAPALQAASAAYHRRGVVFLGVDERDNNAAGKSFQQEFGITYASVVDPPGSLANDYELIGLPDTFVIDAEGQIRYRFTGYLDGPSLRSALEAMLGP